jgi:AsmA protein
MTLPRSVCVASVAVTAVIVLSVAAGAIFVARFDPNSLKPRIIAAVSRATGRDLALTGKISLKLSLWPTVNVKNVAFANPPGFSRPQMVTLQAMQLQLGLLPLLAGRIEIDRLLLLHPDILLETATNGQANWRFTPEAQPGAPGTSPPQAGALPSKKTSVRIDTIDIQDGSLSYRNDATGKVTTLGVSALEAAASSPDLPIHLDADATYSGTAFHVAADTGSLARLQDRAATSRWPLRMTLTVGAAKLTADGSMTDPLRGKGYELAVSGTVPDTASLTPMLWSIIPTPNSAAFPPLHDVTFATRIADTGGKRPEFSMLRLHVGPSDLGIRLPGLMLDQLDVEAPRVDQPMKLAAAARLEDIPITLTATLGALTLLMPDATPAAFPVDLVMQAAGATVSAKGSIADAHAVKGVSVALDVQIPDLSALSPLAHYRLPMVKAVTLRAALTDAAGGFWQGAALHAASLTSPDGDLEGDGAIAFGSRTSLTAVLKSGHIDMDAWQAAFDQAPSAAPPPSTPPATAPQAGAQDTKATPAPKRRDTRLFSDQPIRFDVLRTADADLKLDIADLRSGGADYKAIDTHVVLANGALTVDPFSGDLPGGPLSGTLSANAGPSTPSVHLVLHAPSLALRTIFAAAHQPPYANGNVEINADLSGTGDTPHAIAGSLNGTLGLAVAGGTIDNRLIGSLLGKVMDSLNALNLVGKGGNSELRCFALRMGAKNGIGAVSPLALSSSLLTVTGVGTINLGAETLAMALRPEARIAGTGLVIPLAVSGPIRDPVVKMNDLGAAEANAGTVADAVIGNAAPLGIVGGLLGADKFLGLGATNICPAALATAKGEAVPEAATRADKPNIPNAGAFLKKLFR